MYAVTMLSHAITLQECIFQTGQVTTNLTLSRGLLLTSILYPEDQKLAKNDKGHSKVNLLGVHYFVIFLGVLLTILSIMADDLFGGAEARQKSYSGMDK